jgi:dienelactone hydrolase
MACGSSDEPAGPGGPLTTGSTPITSPSPTSSPSTTDSTTPTTTAYTDFSSLGPLPVAETSGTLEQPDCSLDYVLFTPDGLDDAPLVVLGHGFSRRARHMADLARHVASYGLRVATPDYCHSTPFDTDHEANGLDAAALSAELAGGGPVVHAGYSAGGLAALLAAAADPSTVAVMGLDPVDSGGRGAEALAEGLPPTWGLLGEPSACNEQSNLLEPLRGAGASVSAVPGSTHCDFEAPTDGLCTTFCGDATGVTPLVSALLTAWSVHYLGDDDTTEAWLPGGERYDELVDLGLLISL